MIDAHCHLDEKNHLLKIFVENNIPATINCQNKKEWERNLILTKSYNYLSLSAGIHPWDSDKLTFESFESVLKKAPIIGEIGLDSEWTEIPLEQQKQVFIKQLEFAIANKKPVILHTKGQEMEIAKIIKNYPNNYLVHWYSTTEGLEEFIQLGCYFTIGPSVKTDLAVQNVVTSVPSNRLLFESDGLDALTWATGKRATIRNYLDIQNDNLEFIANLKESSTSGIVAKLADNYTKWIDLSKENLL